jgi:hypothetical protein
VPLVETLRERIARVIYEAPGCVPDTWRTLHAPNKELWLQDADRVIAEIERDYSLVRTKF